MVETTDIYHLTLLEAGRFKVKVPADSVSGESLLPGLQVAVNSRGRESSVAASSFIRALITL